MIVRLHTVAEGQTEETFANAVLRPHLAERSIFLDIRCIETGRRKGKVFRGGLARYQKLKADLKRWMREDSAPEAWFTTMVDLYGLGRLQDEFPGYEESLMIREPHLRVDRIERKFADDINHPRFIPYVQLHEFEALLLAKPEAFRDEFSGSGDQTKKLIEMVAGFDSPELVNDGDGTAPSKRITALFPSYSGQKVSVGPRLAAKIGLPLLRQKCKHFGHWIDRIETLAVL